MTFEFPDASQYNATVPDAPVMLVRATIGAVKDTRYEQSRQLAASRGRPFAGYAFLNHDALSLTAGSGGPGITAEQQADFAYSVLGSVPCMLDWESNRGMDATVDMARRFITRYRSRGGVLNTYYLPHWYWQDHLHSPDLSWFAGNGLHLVTSNYVPYSDTGPGWVPYGDSGPVAWWQFTDNWLASGCDGNAFKGTPEQWWALVDGGVAQPALHTPSEENMGVIAKDDKGQYYHCIGGLRYPVDADAVPGIRYLATQKVFDLASGPGENAEWTDGGQTRLVGHDDRPFGPVYAPGGPPAPVDPDALKAVLMDPEVLAAIAKAVNDDEARRQAE